MTQNCGTQKRDRSPADAAAEADAATPGTADGEKKKKKVRVAAFCFEDSELPQVHSQPKAIGLWPRSTCLECSICLRFHLSVCYNCAVAAMCNCTGRFVQSETLLSASINCELMSAVADAAPQKKEKDGESTDKKKKKKADAAIE